MKNFVKNDNGFICINCGSQVLPLSYTSRDHCPNCLYSVHIDINPGDRANDCLGKLIPIQIEKFKSKYKIIYICEKCGKQTKNVMASDDNMDEIIKISNVEG